MAARLLVVGLVLLGAAVAQEDAAPPASEPVDNSGGASEALAAKEAEVESLRR